MTRHSTRLFQNGLSQAVRIPHEYRFGCEQVYVFQDLLTGDVVFSENPDAWEDYFSVLHCNNLV